MSYKAIVTPIVLILLIGVFFSLVITPLYPEEDIEEAKEDSWTSPFVEASEGIFNFFNVIIQGITGVFRGAGGVMSNILGIESTDQEQNNNINLTDSGSDRWNGEYEWRGQRDEWEQSQGLLSGNTFISYDSEDETDSDFIVWDYSIFLFTNIVYAGNWSESNERIEFEVLEDGEDEGLNDKAYGDIGDRTIDELTKQSEESTQTFIEDARDEVSENIAVIGLIPIKIGLPIIIVSFLSVLYGIIKLMPTT